MKGSTVNRLFILLYLLSEIGSWMTSKPETKHFVCCLIVVFLDRYQVMQDCWHKNPHSRPSFVELTERMGAMLEDTVRTVSYTLT